MAVMQPLPDNPTNADLALGIVQLHECFEEHRNKTKTSFNSAAKERAIIKRNLALTDRKVETLTIKVDNLDKGQLNLIQSVDTLKDNQNQILGSVQVLKDAFKLDAKSIEPKNKPVALMSQFELLRNVGAAITGGLIIWKTGWTVAPYLWNAMQALIK